MGERETKTLTTPNGHSVVFKTYLTGREYREIENVFLSAAHVNAAGQPSGDFDGSIVKRAEDRLVEQAVVSLDGKGEDVLNRCLDLPNEDYTLMVRELNEMKYGEVDAKKKLPS